MKVISKVITWGVTALPLKRNLISRFTKGRGMRNDEECIDGVTSKQEKTYGHQGLENVRALGPGSDSL
jgi:hypothetical protein